MGCQHISDCDIRLANSQDIACILRGRGERIKRSGKEYIWQSDKGKVSIKGDLWYSHYELTGGHTIDFCQKYFGLSFVEAVSEILGKNYCEQDIVYRKTENKETAKNIEKNQKEEKMTKDSEDRFVLPEAYDNMRRIYGYLLNERKLDKDVLNVFVKKGLIYEESKYHGVVFVGRNKEGKEVHAQVRATQNRSSYKCTCKGSDANFSFHYSGKSEKLFVFEAPIDMLAYISMNKQDWHNHSYVALCSISEKAAIQMLKDYRNIKEVYICLDNDYAGDMGALRVKSAIENEGDYFIERLLPLNKDWDEDIKQIKGIDTASFDCDEQEDIRFQGL